MKNQVWETNKQKILNVHGPNDLDYVFLLHGPEYTNDIVVHFLRNTVAWVAHCGAEL